MKNGVSIFTSVSRFIKDIFIQSVSKVTAADVLVITPEKKVASSAYLSTERNKINVGSKTQDAFEIQRARTSSGDGVDLNIKAGNGFGTDKTGGDLNLYGGASTGNINGGALRFWQAARSGSTNSTLNTWTEMFNTEITQSRINFLGLNTLYFPDKDAKISTDQSIELILDADNDDTNRYLAIKDYTSVRALFPDEGNLYLMSASNTTGLFLDAINSRISAGSKAAHSGEDANTDNTGTADQTGISLTIAGGAGTGTGAGGGISFGTYPAGSSSTTANSTYEEKMAMDKDGNLQIDGNLTPAGIVLDGNTITGIDDSDEFTNDDAHIMTSAAIEDKILGYGYTTNTGDITSVAISEGSNVRTVSSGDATISFAEGEGIDVASAALGANAVQLTISGEDASTSNKGVASFSSDNFAASSGAISIKSGGVDLTDEVTGTLPEGNGGTGVTDVKTIVTRQVFTGNFLDDLGTTKHYIPLVDSPNEQTVVYRHEAAIVAPCDGRIASATIRFENLNTHSGDATVTLGVETVSTGGSYAGTWSVEETEPVTLPDTADHDTVHFHFNNDKHFDSTDMFAVSIQSDVDITGTNERFWVTVVVEWDWSTYLGTKGSTTIYSSTP